ncbi:MAG: HD domain-containing protein [Planctomycetota bacterium]|nr:MAG: HD domain-containing protein [Planctomycetota bacterium]
MTLRALPELVTFATSTDGVRIPPGVTVPLTPRVRALLDTPQMRRLSRISQLGLVSLVYPGATHSRLEHSLGVYRMGLEFLHRLQHDGRFKEMISEQDAAAFLVAALVHDIGHWAFCHPLEDMNLPALPTHESLVQGLLAEDEPAAILAEMWDLHPNRVAGLISGTAVDPPGKMLQSMLSGPIDVDKMDYLGRDSLHAGVPYGRHFDEDRLLSSLCLDESGTSLAIDDKGRTAAELLVFARYVMFSEVYWHHTVRAATAMLQRAVWVVRDSIESSQLTRFDDRAFIDWLTAAVIGTPAEPLVAGIFGTSRQLYKRVASFDTLSHPEIHRQLSGRSHKDIVCVAHRLAEQLSIRLGIPLPGESLLIDAPPVEREVEFKLQIRQRLGRRCDSSPFVWRPLAERSPVIRSLAHEQFDDLVKRVRIFAPADVAQTIADCPSLETIILEVT